MALLGERNWYFPKWLNRLPDLTHDEAPEAVTRSAARDDEGERVPV
jgi:RND superfamily putative drug exporter